MRENIRLNKPWLIAVWPGMGHVASSAGYYLMAKLGVHLLAEFRPLDLFDVEHVEVQGGLVRKVAGKMAAPLIGSGQIGRYPRSARAARRVAVTHLPQPLTQRGPC